MLNSWDFRENGNKQIVHKGMGMRVGIILPEWERMGMKLFPKIPDFAPAFFPDHWIARCFCIESCYIDIGSCLTIRRTTLCIVTQLFTLCESFLLGMRNHHAVIWNVFVYQLRTETGGNDGGNGSKFSDRIGNGNEIWNKQEWKWKYPNGNERELK